MANKTIRVQPIRGKFVSATINGKIIRIWLVDPDTNEQGTELAYEDAIEILSLRHPVACPAQIKGKDGKYIEQLDDDDKLLIAERKQKNELGVSETSASNSSSSVAEQLALTQAKLIEAQSDQIESLKKSQEEMAEQMKELVKAVKKTTKNSKTDSKSDSANR